ncbi:MAG: CDP-diacylglycerol--glycerol-3-phosphate 3-phosphatidyltransferase [Verrucomicrobiota bacterium]
MNLPNQLTVGRLILCGLFTVILELPYPWTGLAALSIFIIASITDWLDGYLARKWNLITDFGKLLDPLADKILIAAAYIHFVDIGMAPAWVVVCIVTREFLITGLRMLAAAKGTILAAEKLGKHKTISQIVTALVALILEASEDIGWQFIDSAAAREWIVIPLMMITLFFTLLSGLNYFTKNMHLFDDDKGKNT